MHKLIIMMSLNNIPNDFRFVYILHDGLYDIKAYKL